ncbi:MAG: metallophosphoesterase, partial [Prevotella sp.]|nr:metallophosphoesterase [Prevotella sp.]
MRRIIITITIILALTLNVDAKKKQVVILHTNDTHSCIYPLNPNLADTLLAGRGGFIRRAEMIKQQREENPDLLLIDSGDFSQGSPYYTMYKGDVEIGLMNRMGYDVATIGNHEFDFGVENMARIFKEADFPIVCANYDFAGTALEGIVKPYTIIKRNGLKIGLFGISPQLDGLVFAKTCEGVTYNDPIK